jgi:uncharacterized damage-inducible protein DinB
MTLEKLKFPIGKFEVPKEISATDLECYIKDLGAFPIRLQKEVANLSDEQLDTPYRTEGWTIRQVVNHCADSHMNSFIRFKLALTEDTPTIKPYYEDRWAELSDSKNMPIDPALKMIAGIHDRWTFLIKSLVKEQLQRTFIHPEHGREFRLDEIIAMYAWHSNHHLAHITVLKQNKGWE